MPSYFFFSGGERWCGGAYKGVRAVRRTRSSKAAIAIKSLGLPRYNTGDVVYYYVSNTLCEE